MYESWFQLKRRPFATAPSCETYFPAEGVATALQTVIRCMERGVGPALVIGGAGVGKSMLCLKLRAHFQAHRNVAAVAASGVQSRKALLQSILFELGQPYRDADENELRLQLIDFLTSNESGHGGTVVLIDEAEAMSDTALDEIRGLSNLVQNGEWCVRLLLCGKSSLEEVLAMPAMESLNQRIAARSYLHPWGLRETESYVRFQLDRVGGNADQIFEAAGLRQVYESSGGIPRLVNQLCDHALVLATAGKSRRLDAIAIQEAWSDLQQLPPPMEPGRIVEGEADPGIVEFGGLDDEPPLPETAPEAVSTAPGPQIMPQEPEAATVTAPDSGNTAELSSAPASARSVETRPLGDHPRFADDPERRLDEIEREVSRVSEEFGQFVATSKPSPASTKSSRQDRSRANDPFFEQFEDEEILVDRPAALNELVAVAERTISTDQGLALVEVLRLLEAEMEGATDNDSECPDGDNVSNQKATASFPGPAGPCLESVPDEPPPPHDTLPPAGTLFKFEDSNDVDPPPTQEPDMGTDEPFRLEPPQTLESVWDGPLSESWQSDSTIEFESWQPPPAEQFSELSTPAELPVAKFPQPENAAAAADAVPEEEVLGPLAPEDAGTSLTYEEATPEHDDVVMPAPSGIWVEETTPPVAPQAESATVGTAEEPAASDVDAESTASRDCTPARANREKKFRRLFVDLSRK